jgi:hypothetical protein
MPMRSPNGAGVLPFEPSRSRLRSKALTALAERNRSWPSLGGDQLAARSAMRALAIKFAAVSAIPGPF